MNRRSFFGTFLGGLLCKFLPKLYRYPRPGWTRIPDNLPLYPVVTEMENVHFDGCVVRSIDQMKPASFTIYYVSKNGYVTAPSPLDARPYQRPFNH